MKKLYELVRVSKKKKNLYELVGSLKLWTKIVGLRKKDTWAGLG